MQRPRNVPEMSLVHKPGIENTLPEGLGRRELLILAADLPGEVLIICCQTKALLEPGCGFFLLGLL